MLILGRFTDERKLVLDALREELRQRCYLPILFDFEKPQSRFRWIPRIACVREIIRGFAGGDVASEPAETAA